MVSKAITICISIFSLLLAINVVFANGGDQRIVDGKYLINLSRAPFTPRVGVKTSLLISFVDIQKNKLIAEDLVVKVRIAKLGGGDGKREFLFEKENLIVKGGILELAYTFAKTGLHEIFFDFTFTSSPEIIYGAPDFLIDVQKQENPVSVQNLWFVGVVTGIVGMMIGFLLSKVKSSKQKLQ